MRRRFWCGVSEDPVIDEMESITTLENQHYAQTFLEARGFVPCVVCTSSYHLRRPLWLACDEGLQPFPPRETQSVLSAVACAKRAGGYFTF